MQISSIRGKADLLHNRRVVQAAARDIIISDPVITLAKDFSNENFLKGGYESCGNLAKTVRYSPLPENDLDQEDKEFLYNEDFYMRRNMLILNPVEDN